MSEQIAGLVRLLTRLSLAPSSEVKNLVEENPLLLHPVADRLLGQLISETDTMDTDPAQQAFLKVTGTTKEMHRERLERCRSLLERARQVGIERALEDLDG